MAAIMVVATLTDFHVKITFNPFGVVSFVCFSHRFHQWLLIFMPFRQFCSEWAYFFPALNTSIDSAALYLKLGVAQDCRYS